MTAELSNRLEKNIHQLIMDIDYELGDTSNREYRRHLVKTTYALRDLELFIQIRSADYYSWVTKSNPPVHTKSIANIR